MCKFSTFVVKRHVFSFPAPGDEAERRKKMEEMVRKELEDWDEAGGSRPGTGK